ncbi:MAG TPA: cobalamin-binding protein [Acidimicrobiales bacterium]|nr:cobalamin-binding protein [Acidimicrobiales bacterium]
MTRSTSTLGGGAPKCGVGHTLGMRIVSLLPSATEIVFALGLEDDLVGVTHECDWPEAARLKPIVSVSALPEATTPAEVDRLVSASLQDGDPIYRLDEVAMRDLAPDLVLSQDLCAVCAVPSGRANEALDALGCQAEVLAMDPSSLEEVLDCVVQVGRLTGTEAHALDLVAQLKARLRRVEDAVAGLERVRTFALEWSDPPYNGGHWVAEMIEIAGGEPLLANRGTDSVRMSWDRIASEEPDVVVFMPCGYGLEQAVEEAGSLLVRNELRSADRIYAVDANAFFSRPGPRLVDGVEMLAATLHPGSVDVPTNAAIRRIR